MRVKELLDDGAGDSAGPDEQRHAIHDTSLATNRSIEWYAHPVSDAVIRERAAEQPVPEFESTPFTTPPPLERARVAIVTTAALRAPGHDAFGQRDESFRVLDPSADSFMLGHGSPNFDRSGWLQDVNVVFPVDRLRELAEEGRIGSVASRHIAFAGNQNETMTTMRMDSGPAAASLLRRDGVDVVVLTGV
jgi:D-proline reductase (dithiol) PrdB